MQEPQVTLESADKQQFVLPQSVAFISDYVKTLKTGGFREATQEGPLKLPEIPAEELSTLVQIMNTLHANQALPKEIQAAAVAQVPQITPQNIDALINDARFLQLPENCIAGLINRLAEFIYQQKTTEVPFDNRKMLTQLGRTYFLKYEQDLRLADDSGNPIDIGFSIRELLDAGKRFPVDRTMTGTFQCDLQNRRINSLEGLLHIPEINRCQKIVLNRNRISSIQPGAFQGLSNLADLDLANNQIASIQPGAFQGLSNLEHLVLRKNQITSIQPDAFQGLSKLQRLLLNDNQITSIQPGMFQGLSNLRFLFLNDNQITSIQPGTFQGLSNLRFLFLDNNRISTIQPGTFAGPPLKTLDLSDNRLSADIIERVREELPPGCKLEAENQREETPAERREKLTAAVERRMQQQ